MWPSVCLPLSGPAGVTVLVLMVKPLLTTAWGAEPPLTQPLTYVEPARESWHEEASLGLPVHKVSVSREPVCRGLRPSLALPQGHAVGVAH